MNEELSEAISAGDLARVKKLMLAGADIRYVRRKGYTAMIDVMHGRSITDDPNLLPLMRLLIARGAYINATSDYGETALKTAARVGRFDAVALLLKYSVDESALNWTPLMKAVAFGSESEVAELLPTSDLTATDYWGRAAWLLSVQAGDIAKATQLLKAGANIDAHGNYGQTALLYATEYGKTGMVRWLLELGCDPNEADDFGDTPLKQAVQHGDTESTRLLLDAGADVLHGSRFDSAIHVASTPDVARLLVHAGAEFSSVNQAVRIALTTQTRDVDLRCTPAEFAAARSRIDGTANPEPMNHPFWRAMVRTRFSAYHARMAFGDESLSGEPIWCFDRFGHSLTELPDGRMIEIGGEHEDHYDPDFCIYNDVVVHHGDGTFTIYGYPKEVFSPTDFHSATLIGDCIYIIGRLGYHGERHFGTTPVYRLNLHTFAIEQVATTGDSPGWIYDHQAKRIGTTIELRGGKVAKHNGEMEVHEENTAIVQLDVPTCCWSRRG